VRHAGEDEDLLLEVSDNVDDLDGVFLLRIEAPVAVLMLCADARARASATESGDVERRSSMRLTTGPASARRRTDAICVQDTVRQFGRAIVMPNLRPPVTTTSEAQAYRRASSAALPRARDSSR